MVLVKGLLTNTEYTPSLQRLGNRILQEGVLFKAGPYGRDGIIRMYGL